MDALSPARKKKKRPAASRDRVPAQEPLAIVEVPPDSGIYETALLLSLGGPGARRRTAHGDLAE